MVLGSSYEPDLDLDSSHTPIDYLEQKTETFAGLGGGLFTLKKKNTEQASFRTSGTCILFLCSFIFMPLKAIMV